MTDEHIFKTPNGLSIHTPGGLPQIEQCEENGHLAQRTEYSNGWILITKWRANKQLWFDSNYSLTNLPDGSLTPLYDHPNPDFVDQHDPQKNDH